MIRPWGSFTDVPGLRVGHAGRSDDGWSTGVTVVVPPADTVGAVDVRGGGPATRETDALAPSTLVATVDAVCLVGGSAYGLAAADGVMRWCEEQGRGFGVGPPEDRRALVVPIVPAAAVFDLGRGGDPAARPTPAMGYRAAAALGADSPSGAVGAGTGALAAAGALAGGVGQSCVRVPIGDSVVSVGALVVLNAAGSPVDPDDGGLLGRAAVPTGLPRPPIPPRAQADAVGSWLADHAPRPSIARTQTTLAVVATDAALDPAAAHRTACAGHDGLARTLRPVHTLLDGDTVFALATGAVPIRPTDLVTVQSAAADAVLLAVLDATLAAPRRRTPAVDAPGYLDLCPGARLVTP